MPMAPLASRLEGKIIDNKWEVIKKRHKTEDDDSGAFSSCYEVKNIENGQSGFLKAINYQYAFKALGTSTDSLQRLTENYNYERDLLAFCKDKKMSRVVTAIAHGEYKESGQLLPVPYLVFEIATGSLKNVKPQKQLDLTWKMGAIHGFLVGLSQLHQEKIVHQDIKPSNILIFGHGISKLADLGNATKSDKKSPVWNSDGHCGDIRYAPIELLYNYCSPDWEARRLGADLFMAGGIITYLLTDANFLWILIENLPDSYRPLKFGGSFEDVKPHLVEAYNKSLQEIKDLLDMRVRKGLIEIIAQLTHPIPEERGIPKTLITSLSQYSLHRYISVIDRIAKQLEIGQK